MPFPIRAVSFDAVGTFLHPAEPIARTYARMARAYGLAANEARVRARVPQAMRIAGPYAPQASDDRHEAYAWWRKVVAYALEAAVEDPRFAAAFDALFAYFAEPAAWRVHPAFPEMLQRLKARGLEVAVCSNWDQRLVRLLEKLGLAFDVVMLPACCGAAKPSAEIFAALARALSLRPEMILHVGDAPEDEEGPPQVGMHGRRWVLAPGDDANAAWARLEAWIEECSHSWPWRDAKAWRRAALQRPDGVGPEEIARRRAHAARENERLGIRDPERLSDQELYIRGKMTLDEYAAYLALKYWPQPSRGD